ncbi:hypothetical protein [Loigolactobacillus zhaoyuanensis]|uniref:Uncharacterized protein n=1 Tax=Loigolactobacillus zhaoyuanensis TaxID=2486017 RepID=A0ABW8UDH5_9LACO
MAQPNLVLTKQPESRTVKPVFIDANLHRQLLDLKNETSIPIGRIVEKFVRYGIQNVEIEDEQ